MASIPEPPIKNKPPSIRRKRHLLVKIFRTSLLGYGMLILILLVMEKSLLFPAPRTETGDWSAHQALNFIEVKFTSPDGTKLHGWYAPHPHAQHVILYCHGNATHVALCAATLQKIRQELNASVFLFDYRGYGKSAGSPHEAGLIEDGLAAQKWLAQENQIQPSQVILIGRSLGGAVATALAQQQGCQALVLQNTFARVTDVGASMFPWVPVRLIMRNKFDSVSRIKKYSGPLYHSHSKFDQLIPLTHGKELFTAAPTSKKIFLLQPGGHNSALPSDYYQQLATFLKEVTLVKE